MAKEQTKPPSLKDNLPLDVFELDQNRLDKHFLEQPKLVITYALQLADAQDAHSRAKASLDVIKAEAEKEIIDNPQDYGLTKTTVDAIRSAVERHKLVQVAVERLQRRKNDVEILQAMMNALEHRKRALEGLVQLHGQSYFATPRSTPEFNQSVQERNKAAVRRGRPVSQEDQD